MPRRTVSFNRREVLQQMGIVGIGAVFSACGGGGNGAEPTATQAPQPTLTPTAPAATATSAAATPTTAARATATAPATNTATQVPPTPTPTPSFTVTPDDIACILSPEETIGPYFIDVGLARSDVREVRSGVALRLALQLVDVDGCTPIRDAVVNIWHADARGAYSGFANQPGGIDTTGETFLRGFQITDANGRVEFTTVYPGWYTGRTPHIHVRIHLDSVTVLVTQVYFDESVTDAVYDQPPYNVRPNQDTTNASDSIARNDLDELTLTLAAENGGYAGTIVFGVDL